MNQALYLHQSQRISRILIKLFGLQYLTTDGTLWQYSITNNEWVEGIDIAYSFSSGHYRIMGYSSEGEVILCTDSIKYAVEWLQFWDR